LVLSALIVGSLTPDIQYFTSYPNVSRFSHTVPGVFVFCVPVGLLFLWTFHRVLKLPLISLMPPSQRPHLVAASREFSFRPLSRLLWIVLSLVLGALTHLVWDAVTHEGGEVLQPLARLDAYLQSWPAFASGYGYDLMQHGSTLLGAVAMFLWYRGWLRHARTGEADSTAVLALTLSSPARRSVLAAMLAGAVVLAIFYARARFQVQVQPGMAGVYQWLVHYGRAAALSSMLVLLVEVLLFSLFWHIVARGECVLQTAAPGAMQQAVQEVNTQEVDTGAARANV
jgi:hypothetical protein